MTTTAALVQEAVSAARHVQSTMAAAAPPPGWLSTSAAARILGLSDRAVQVRCSRGDLPAVSVEGPGGPRWLLDPDGHAAFRIARGRSSGPVAADDLLAGLSDAKRAVLYERHRACEAFLSDSGCRPAAMGLVAFRAAWIREYALAHPEAKNLSPRTLQRWLRAYRQDGLEGLVDGRRQSLSMEMSPEALEFLIGLYLSEEGPTLAHCWRMTRALAPSKGWHVPTYGAICRLVRRRLDPKTGAMGRDPRRYRDRGDLILARDWGRVAAMELWIADHRQLDVWVPRQARDGAWSWHRPWLTAFIDARSWWPVGWTLAWDSPDANRVMATFVRAVREHGLPEWLYLDNGKDFRAGRFSGGRREGGGADAGEVESLLGILGVEIVWATPYNARAKTIEPWFRAAISERFDKRWDTWCGSSPEHRPERLKGLDAARLAAEGLSLEAVRAALDEYLRADYAALPCPVRASRGMSVMAAFLDLRAPDFAKTRPADETLRFLLLPSKPLTVRQDGLHVAEFAPTTYWAAELEDRRAASGADESRKVVVRYDPGDPAAVWVFDRSGNYLCEARPYLGAGLHPVARAGSDADRAALAEAITLQRECRKAVREDLGRYRDAVRRHAPHLEAVRRAGDVLGLHDPEALARAAVEAERPAAIRPLVREADRAAADAQRNRRRRAAQGLPDAIPTAADLVGRRPAPQADPGGHCPSALDLLARRYKESAHGTAQTA